MFFVTKEGPTVGGWDITLGSKGLARTWARALVQRWGGQVKETTSTVGRRDGVDVARLTVLYRRPGYGIGDVLRFKEALWRVAGWTPDGALLLRVERSERLGATWRDLERSRVVALNKDILQVDILHRDATVAEVMEPISWTTIPIRILGTMVNQVDFASPESTMRGSASRALVLSSELRICRHARRCDDRGHMADPDRPFGRFGPRRVDRAVRRRPK